MKIKKQLLLSILNGHKNTARIQYSNRSAKIGKKYIPSPEKIPFRGLFFSTIVVDRTIMV